MYTEENLKTEVDELRQKIASTTITDEAFNEIESELLELEHKRGVVRNQVLALVAEAQGMCKLDARPEGNPEKSESKSRRYGYQEASAFESALYLCWVFL